MYVRPVERIMKNRPNGKDIAYQRREKLAQKRLISPKDFEYMWCGRALLITPTTMKESDRATRSCQGEWWRAEARRDAKPEKPSIWNKEMKCSL